MHRIRWITLPKEHFCADQGIAYTLGFVIAEFKINYVYFDVIVFFLKEKCALVNVDNMNAFVCNSSKCGRSFFNDFLGMFLYKHLLLFWSHVIK